MIPAVETLAVTPQVQYRSLLDTITAHVTSCSGYEIVCFEGGLIHTYFKYPGGEVPLPIDPCKPVPYLVEMVSKAIRVWQAIKAFDVAKCG